jgi:hypothetical protein
MAQVIECLPSKNEALSSDPSTTTATKKKKNHRTVSLFVIIIKNLLDGGEK